MRGLSASSQTVLLLVSAAALLSASLAGAAGHGHVALGAAAIFLLALALWSAAPKTRRASQPKIEAGLRALDTQYDEAREERLQMRLRAEAAGRFREEFVNAVRHELNTPLNVILVSFVVSATSKMTRWPRP